MLRRYKSEDSFTLVELLVVIGVVSVLSVMIVIVINPLDYLKQARDSKRIQDLASIDKSLTILETQGYTSFGTSTTVYISLPDTSSTCGNLSLPGLPVGYVYNCVTSENLRKTDGTGWIPVDFESSGITHLSSLPIDPVNSVSANNYYTYMTGGSWKLSVGFESTKYSQKLISDGGIDPATYEKGSDLDLPSFSNGLIGYWKFDEASGATTNDSSGLGNTGTMYSSTTITSLFTSANCKRGSCIILDANDDNTILESDPIATSSLTAVAWMYPTSLGGGNYGQIIKNGKFAFAVRTSNRAYGINNGATLVLPGYNFTFSLNQWSFVAFTRTSTGLSTLYVNGLATGPYNQNGGTPEVGTTPLCIGNDYASLMERGFGGYLDDIMLYGRVLSPTEIKILYEATR